MSLLQDIAEKIIHSRYVRKFAEKFPKLYTWLLLRLSIKKFTGLPLLIFLVVFIFNVSMLWELSEDLFNSSAILFFDKFTSDIIQPIRKPLPLKLFYFFTLLGNTYVVIVITLLISLILLFRKRYYQILGLLLSTLGAGLTITIGKNYFHRVRPQVFNYYELTSFSFPSGHATLSVALYGFLIYLITRNIKSRKTKTVIFSTGTFFIFLLGFSRLYLGVHFLSDVLGGWFLGSLWLLLAISIVEIMHQKKNEVNG